MNDARLLARGFCLSPMPVDELEQIEHYGVRRVGDFYLYADELVEVDVYVRDDDWAVVVGKAWPMSSGIVAADCESPAAELFALLGAQGDAGVEEALYDFAGRYAVILRRDERVTAYTDAGGTRSVYFNSRDGVIGSHFSVLANAATGGERRPPLPGAKNTRQEAYWDLTWHSDISIIYPNNRLELPEGKQVRFHLTKPNRYVDVSGEERLATIEQLWHEQLDRMVAASEGRPIAFSMTGGQDSRTSLALARDYRKYFSSFTYTSEAAVAGKPGATYWAKTMSGDYEIVRAMAEFLPDQHRFIVKKDSKDWQQRNAEVMQRNTANGHGAWLLPHYMEQFPDPRTIHYRGNLLEIGRMSMRGSLARSPQRRMAELAKYYASKTGVEAELMADFFLEKMVQMGFDSLDASYVITDVFYWENRHVRWYSEVLNETDTAFDTITPINVRRSIDALLAFPVAQRNRSYAQHELIHRNWPVLEFFPFNATENLYERFVRPTLTSAA
ncbi:hypothetical protein [Gulosibacter faecalis]|uniref:Asparagine synthase n=1 Tax=Gulosibacter faecalis TaxID=272240 RepID=A0ABW5V1N3_9MICO|nr:hypothetical protein [Gulosibacter faecalis]